MMATILNSAMLDSDTAILDSGTLFSFLIFTPKHSPSTLTLSQTNSIWLKLSHLSFSSQTISHLPRLVPNICTKKLHSFILTQHDDGSHLELCQHGFNHFAQKQLHSFILTELDDGSHLELCHHGFNHFFQKKNFTHPFWLNLMIAAILKSVILNSAILLTKKLHSFILTQLDDGSHLELCHHGFNHFAKKELHSFILTQLDDGIYLEFFHLDFCHLGFSHFAQNSDST